jgi:hypothetical protein
MRGVSHRFHDGSKLLLALYVAIVVSIAVPTTGQAQALLAITSPADGTVVNAGQTIQVTVASPAGATFTGVGLIGESNIGTSDTAARLPAMFSMTLPSDLAPRRYLLTARGTTTDGRSASTTIELDVERTDFPTRLSSNVSRLTFEAQGQDGSVSVMGTFSGGTFDVTESSLVSYSTSDPAIVTVDAFGNVTAVAPGTATVTITYGQGARNIQALIPVTVPKPIFTMSPISLDFGTQDVSTSASLQMTLTNTSTADLGILEVKTSGDFSESDDCTSSSPLSRGASCTITVTFRPSQTGLRTSRVRVANSFNTVPVGFLVSGTGRSAGR